MKYTGSIKTKNTLVLCFEDPSLLKRDTLAVSYTDAEKIANDITHKLAKNGDEESTRKVHDPIFGDDRPGDI